jgi:hypothetical protein
MEGGGVMREPELITTSRLRTFNACRRLHHYKYELGYRPLVDREDAAFGTIFHAGLEQWWLSHLNRDPGPALLMARVGIADATMRMGVDESTAAKADLLMVGYDARWAPTMGQFQVLGVEQRFVAMLPTPEGAVSRRLLRVAGKLDALVRRRDDGSVWIVEHKTTGADLTPGSLYWQRLRMDTQVSVYFEGVRALGYQPAGCIYDVISRPDSKPLKATPLDKRKYRKDGALYANQRAEDETMAEFKARLAEEIAAAPETFFQRSEVVRLERELEESRRDTYDTSLMIREAANQGRAPRNPDQCFAYGQTCPFFDVCCGAAELEDPTRFKRLENVHPELADD